MSIGCGNPLSTASSCGRFGRRPGARRGRGFGPARRDTGGPAAPGVQVVTANDRTAAHRVALHTLDGARAPVVLSHPLDRTRGSGLLSGPDPRVAFPVTRMRLEGFRAAFRESERGWADAPVAVVARHSREDGARAIAALPGALRPDVVIAMSDQLAASALDVLGDAVRVSGWDDSPLAAAMRFSSVEQSLFDQGVACARIAAGLTTTVAAASWRVGIR